ncbi:MAG TPA: cupin domain-containing protein [Nannocystaceae bacterium]|nr:cupin domain-containing protein [Nannocystaceae bacterium]
MSRDDDFDLDPEEGLEALEALALALPRPSPSPGLRDRLLASVAAPERRLAPFADRLAALFDVAVARASELLAALADPRAWKALSPGIGLVDVDGGPAIAGADVGFVRVEPGHTFPHHRHLGSERALILRGALVESDGRIFRAGDEARMEAESEHSFAAGPDEALVFAVVVFGVDLPGYERTTPAC